ncbi:unnamed protein product [Gongylonema pulchrum]|uniref:Uncharacterized protein n=1 Tax=Gongylonema pulchrum TaxID=637853 RepID=A0A183DLP9_9BILA|nr:unnamed protein product [Gongylonema pulchrum]VDK75141.1 unnamed protein product [Gongylonema pulchrum]
MVSVGDHVRVASGDVSGRLLKGVVSHIRFEDCCTVNFMDRNWSDDLPAEDIVECECSRFNCNGWHVPGAKVGLVSTSVGAVSENFCTLSVSPSSGFLLFSDTIY